MLRFEDVSFQYAEAVTVSHLDFHIRKGDFTALIGANGAGKSTISKLCNGLLKPTSGRVLVRGRDSRTAKTSQLSRFVGFLFQNPDRADLPEHHPGRDPLWARIRGGRPRRTAGALRTDAFSVWF